MKIILYRHVPLYVKILINCAVVVVHLIKLLSFFSSFLLRDLPKYCACFIDIREGFRPTHNISYVSIDLHQRECNFCSVLSGCMEAVSSVRDGIRTDKQKHGFARFENVPEGNVQIADVPGTSEREVVDVEGITQLASGRFENPLYRSKRNKTEEEDKILDIDAPLSLTTLKGRIDQLDQAENEEMDTEE